MTRLFCRKVSSGGTTGAPVTFYEYYWVTALERMYLLYMWSRIGWRPTDRTVVLRGDRISAPTERRGRMLVVSSYLLPQHTAAVAAEVAAFRPQWIWAYPSVFLNFRDRAGAELRLDELKGFLFGSEKLHGWQREELARSYPQARILEWYGMSEKAALAYRIHPDRSFTFLRSYAKVMLQPLDDTSGWPRRCIAIGTSLIQAPTRVEAYRTGDILTVQADGTVTDVAGREQDFILLDDGGWVPFSQVVGSIHSDVWEQIRRFRFVQARAGEIEIYVEERRSEQRRYTEQEFNHLIAAALGHNVRLKFHFGEIVPLRSPSGKEIYFVQELKAG